MCLNAMGNRLTHLLWLLSLSLPPHFLYVFQKPDVCGYVRAHARALLGLPSLVAVTSEPQFYLLKKGSYIFFYSSLIDKFHTDFLTTTTLKTQVSLTPFHRPGT